MKAESHLFGRCLRCSAPPPGGLLGVPSNQDTVFVMRTLVSVSRVPGNPTWPTLTSEHQNLASSCRDNETLPYIPLSEREASGSTYAFDHTIGLWCNCAVLGSNKPKGWADFMSIVIIRTSISNFYCSWKWNQIKINGQEQIKTVTEMLTWVLKSSRCDSLKSWNISIWTFLTKKYP